MFETLPTSPAEFRAAVLFESIKALKVNLYKDNYDAARFNLDGVDKSRLFSVDERVYWFCWFQDNFEGLFRGFQLLKTDRSKTRFLSLLAFRLAGHHSMRVDTSFDRSPEAIAAYLAREGGGPSALGTAGSFGALRHFDFDYEGTRYIVDCHGLEYYLFRRQYFFDEGGVRVQVEPHDHVVDGGACLGDASLVFAKAAGSEGAVYAFDPVQDHIDVIRHNAAQNTDCTLRPMPFGLSDSDVEGPTVRTGVHAPAFRISHAPVPLRSLDSLVSRGVIPKVDFIKLDVEGSELAALKGAMTTIRTHKPKLAISLYHKPNDLFEIPLFIQEQFPFYEMYLGHYTIHNEETVLYCRPVA